MKQQDKELLLKDLCARLPYGVKCVVTFDKYNVFTETLEGVNTAHCRVSTSDSVCEIELIKPYLRPMSSMTEEEKKELGTISCTLGCCGQEKYHEWGVFYQSQDWLNAHHFDYRGLIEKGLAVEVTKENNPYE